MNRQTLVRGALAGMAGGVVMAMWSMIVLWLTGVGFWAPLNFIAHTFWRGAPLDETFSGGALILGLVIHMMMSAILGMMLAIALSRPSPASRNRAALAVSGMVFGIVVWLVMQYLIWPAIDEAAAPLFTAWVFAIGHLMYGLVTGASLAPATAEHAHPAHSQPA